MLEYQSKSSRKFILIGFLASLALLIFYFAILILISGWSFALSQFLLNWYWIIGLSFGFGVQIGMFTYLRALHKEHVSRKLVAASGTTSTIAMISCCAHYLVNILPIIGISGLVAIIGQYQTELFVVGLLSNLLGIAYMVNKLIKFNKREI